MSEKRMKYDQEFRDGAVRIVRETGAGTLGNWVAVDQDKREGRGELSTSDFAELKRSRAENAELRMKRDDAPMFVKRLRAACSALVAVR